MLKIPRRIYLLLGSAACLGALAYAVLDGLWIPNKPSGAEYPIRGIDVSRHQGKVDWNAVAASGIRFVYLKATEGGDFRDASFAENLAGARAVGLQCGAYHFFSLKTPGLAQARNFIATVPRGACTLPCAIDLEYTGNSAERPPVGDFQKQLTDFVDAIRTNYGREPVFYVDEDLARDYLGGYAMHDRWVRAVVFRPGSDWMFWQYSELGRVPGIHGFVDLDVFNSDELIR
jgi:lysozyme